MLDGNGAYRGLENGQRVAVPRNNVDNSNIYSFVATASLRDAVNGDFNSIAPTDRDVTADCTDDGEATLDFSQSEYEKSLVVSGYDHIGCF